jgi:hypothetical protein
LGAAFAQSDRGTITGTVSDPAGARIAGATVQAKNTETGAEYQAATTETGNYVLAQLPVGAYQLSVSMQGFKSHVRQGLTVSVAQTVRIDVALELGAISESVTVSADAPLLKTESGELGHNVKTDTLNQLPILSIGSAAGGNSGIRNPYAVMQLLPGTDWRPDASVRVNGTPGNTQAMRIEGQDSTNNLWAQLSAWVQPSVDAVQEFAVQTSNYAAEYGQAGSAVFNLTMRSGTNQVHGSAYEYLVNEALNAGQPFTRNAETGEHLRPRARRHDFGFTFGGPIFVPKAYDGRDKAFFFFNFEEFRETIVTNNFRSVPTEAMRNGDFSALLGANPRQIGTDPIGRPVIENTIYDPATERIVNNVRLRDPFPNNKIPVDRFDPVAVKIQSMIPLPNFGAPGASINNFLAPASNTNLTYIPSLKLDYSISPLAKLSGYWSRTYTMRPSGDGMPAPITSAQPREIVSNTVRINYDHTVSPTMLLHLGAGLVQTVDALLIPSYDPLGQLGLKGTNADAFPYLQTMSNGFGGFSGTMGPGSNARYVNLKPTANVSFTWVKGNHTYKYGAEMIVESHPSHSKTFANGWWGFNAVETSDSSLQDTLLTPGATAGFPYASFLLGRVNNVYHNAQSRGHLGSHAFSFFAQDTWKVTPKLTLDYGLRYDYQTYLQEQYGRWSNFSPTTPNPSAGGLLGAVIFEGEGPGRCNCDFANVYPWAFGPRLGLAYQITPKWVLRAGSGISYGRTPELGYLNNTLSTFANYTSPSYADPATTLAQGQAFPWSWPNFNPGMYPPTNGVLASPPVAIDRNAGRPPRIFQWSIGLQRELTQNLLVEASYIGNRGVWWQAGPLVAPNALTPDYLQTKGLDINNPADQQLLQTQLRFLSPANAARFPAPYTGFPLTATVAQAIRPFPQFRDVNMIWAPLGSTWYDALQVKLTKRFSHNFDFNYSFTWQKELTIGAETSYNLFATITPQVNDVFDRNSNKYISGLSRPLISVISGTYKIPRLFENKVLSGVTRDWQFSGMLRYQSGQPIRVPTSGNLINAHLARPTPTFANRVPGEPLFTVDLNCNCFDPNTTFVLNPKAWAEPARGQFGTSAAYYNDYRGQRHPTENLSLARNFNFGREGMYLQFRAEFTNIFNRTYLADPTSTSAGARQTTNVAGQNTGGFGWINTASLQTLSNPRQGTLVMRLVF